MSGTAASHTLDISSPVVAICICNALIREIQNLRRAAAIVPYEGRNLIQSHTEVAVMRKDNRKRKEHNGVKGIL
jgi:hypothetical protein